MANALSIIFTFPWNSTTAKISLGLPEPQLRIATRSPGDRNLIHLPQVFQRVNKLHRVFCSNKKPQKLAVPFPQPFETICGLICHIALVLHTVCLCRCSSLLQEFGQQQPVIMAPTLDSHTPIQKTQTFILSLCSERSV